MPAMNDEALRQASEAQAHQLLVLRARLADLTAERDHAVNDAESRAREARAQTERAERAEREAVSMAELAHARDVELNALQARYEALRASRLLRARDAVRSRLGR